MTVPFFPPLTKKVGTPLILKGLVLGVNPIGYFLYSLISSKMLGILGQKKLFCLGIIAQSISISAFGALHHLDDDITFINICIFSRLVQGFSRAAVISSFPGYIAKMWPQQIKDKTSLIQRVAILGTLLGPAIGQVFYSFIGDFIPFYVISFIYLLSLVAIIYLPKNIKMNYSKDTRKYYKYLSDKKIFSTFLISIGASTAQSFITPLYAAHIQGLGLTSEYIGYFYTLSSIFYIIFLFSFPVIQRYINRQAFLTIGILISVIGIEFQAPESQIEKLIGVSLNQWYIVTIGQCFTNICSSMCLLPMMPELYQLIIDKEVFNNQICLIEKPLKKKCREAASRIFILGTSLGSFIGPFSVSIIYQQFEGNDINKYMNTSRCIACFIFLIFLVYITFGNSCFSISYQINFIKNLALSSQRIKDCQEIEDKNLGFQTQNIIQYMIEEEAQTSEQNFSLENSFNQNEQQSNYLNDLQSQSSSGIPISEIVL
ncbi:hypothetical protein ABPG74_021791 [Tetrahymena malaccensis]